MGDGHEQRPGGIEKAGTVSEGRGQTSKGLGHQVTGSLALSWGRWSALKLKRGQKVFVWTRTSQDTDVTLGGAVYKGVDGVLEDQQGWGLLGTGQ